MPRCVLGKSGLIERLIDRARCAAGRLLVAGLFVEATRSGSVPLFKEGERGEVVNVEKRPLPTRRAVVGPGGGGAVLGTE